MGEQNTTFIVVLSMTTIAVITYATLTYFETLRLDNEHKCRRTPSRQDRVKVAEERATQRVQECVRAKEHPPEIVALLDLAEAYRINPGDWSALLACGDIYAKGAYPRLRPHDEMALRCYSCASRCPDPIVAGQGMAKYINTRLHGVPKNERCGEAITVNIGNTICDRAEQQLAQCVTVQRPKCVALPPPTALQPQLSPPYTRVHRAPNFQTRVLPAQRATQRATQCATQCIVVPVQCILPTTPAPQIVRRNKRGRGRRDTGPPPQTVTEPVPVPVHRVDPQNVHENSVVAAVRTNIDTMKALAEFRPPVNSQRVVREVGAHVKCLSPDKAADAALVLSKLSDDTHSTFGTSEKEALGLVWDKIESIQDPKVKSNVRDTLCAQLADCVENGLIVCSTGKISRVMTSLEGVDCIPLEKARPVWAISSELAQLASNVRERCLHNVTPEQQEDYNTGHNDALSTHMQDQFQQEAMRTYCEELGMDKKIVNPLLNVYKDAL
jgi:hypothetical protein